MPERIFIDRPLPPGFDELFGTDWEVVGPDDAELPTCRAAIAGASPWPAERIAKGAMLEVISRSGIGFDTVDLDAAAAQGVVVCNTPDAPSISTAEHTMSLLMAASKFTANNVARLRAGRQDFYAAHEGIELSGATIGVVGHGRIGSRVARMCAAKTSDDGKVCGSGDEVSAITLISNLRAPEIRCAINSASASRPVVGKCELASRIFTSARAL
jgi:hypothetical protein